MKMNNLQQSLASLDDLLNAMSTKELLAIYDEVHKLPIDGITVEQYFDKQQYNCNSASITELQYYPPKTSYNNFDKKETSNFSGFLFYCNIAA